VLIAKGILSKIIDTSNGGEDDAEVQWKVKEVRGGEELARPSLATKITHTRTPVQPTHPSTTTFIILTHLPNPFRDSLRSSQPQEVCDVIADADFELSKAGYKTIAIAVSKDGGKTMSLVGVLPMLDPPREVRLKRRRKRHTANSHN